MTRLKFNQVSEKFTAKGYTLTKLSKGYKVGDVKLARLDSAIEWLDNQIECDETNLTCTLTCECPETIEEEWDELVYPYEFACKEEEASSIYWSNWDAVYWKALVKMRSNYSKVLSKPFLPVVGNIFQRLIEVLIDRQSIIYRNLMKLNFKATAKASSRSLIY